jgi:SSS family solute:Na+ symporter
MILIVALIYFVVLIIGAGILSRKRIKSTDDFTNASRSLAWPMVMTTFAIIPLGSGHSMSLWQQAIGPLGGNAAWWGLAVGAIIVPLMMLWTGPLARWTGFRTFPEITKAMYGRAFSQFHAAVTTASFSGIIAGEMIATGVAIFTLSDGEVPLNPTAILIAFALTILYIFFGGVLQMAWINIVNAIMLIAGSFAALIGIVIWVGKNFIFNGASGLEAVQVWYENEDIADRLSQFSSLGTGPQLLFDLIIPVALLHITATGVSQGHNLPFLAAKSTKDCRKGIYFASAINFMSCVPWILIGLIAFAVPAVTNAIAPERLGELIVPGAALLMLPKPLTGILMVSLLSATLSTAGAVTMGNGTLLAHEIIKGALFPKMSDKNELILTRVCIIGIACICLFPALNLPLIMPVFMWCFMLSIPIWFIYMTGIYFSISKTWCWVTVVIAYVIAFWWTFAPPAVPWPWGTVTYPVALVSFIFGMLIPAIHGRVTGKQSFRRQIIEAREKMPEARLS